MIFERSWLLLAALLPLAWAAYEFPRTQRRLGLVLKAVSLAAILVALAEPVLKTTETKSSVIALVDTSASVSDADLKGASETVARMQGARGRNELRVIPFAQNTRPLDKAETANQFSLRRTSGAPGRNTDLEDAVRESLAAMPEGLVPRIALFTDGRETTGSAMRAAWQAQQLGVAIDVFPMKGRPKPDLQIESVSMPAQAFTGEKFPVELQVSAPRAAPGSLEIQAEGKTLGKSDIRLEPGSNRVRVNANLSVAGSVDIAVTVRGENLGEVRFEQAVNLRRPRLLYVSQDPAGTETNLRAVFNAAQFDVTFADAADKGRLSDFQLVVYNNWDLESLTSERKNEIEQFVKRGGGLLVLGGEKNIYLEGKKIEDALDRTLPAKLAPPRSPEGTCVVLILDKSSSMEGRKMELARTSAIGVVENLRAIDLVGVLIFDNSFQWAIPIRRAEDRTLMKRLIAGITPDGGTQIAPALAEAYRKIRPVNATYKHVVLLTDGISEEGDSLELAKEATQSRVTISTVGLGQDVNRAYLEKVASFAGGKSYFLTEPAGLEQILLRDVMEHTGSTAVEKPLKPVVMRRAEILEGTNIESAPALKGYVKFKIKPEAEQLLMIDKDPLYSRWQYGLGRSAIFASDAKARWAADWVTWNGFDKFWINVLRDLLPHAQPAEASAQFDQANGELVVDYRLGRGVEPPARIPPVYVVGPGGFQKQIPVEKVAEGAYRGKLPVGQLQGLFRIRTLEESRIFPEVGLYRQEQELAQFGADEPTLKQLALHTGGRFNPNPTSVFDTAGRGIPKDLPLWPGILGAAVTLSLAELLLRKWRGVFRKA